MFKHLERVLFIWKFALFTLAVASKILEMTPWAIPVVGRIFPTFKLFFRLLNNLTGIDQSRRSRLIPILRALLFGRLCLFTPKAKRSVGPVFVLALLAAPAVLFESLFIT